MLPGAGGHGELRGAASGGLLLSLSPFQPCHACTIHPTLPQVIDELPPGVGRNKGRDVRSFHVRDDSCADYLLPGCPGWHFREGCVLLLHGARHKEAQLWEVWAACCSVPMALGLRHLP